MQKKKKPKFIRQEAYRRKKLGISWRRPRGIHSKIRLRKAGKMKRVSIGYRNPEKLRGLTNDGKRVVRVLNSKDLKAVGENAAILSGSLGRKKKLEILESAKKAEISFLNIKDVAVAISKIKSDIEKQKLEKKKRLEAKKKKKPKKEEKKAEKKEEKIEEKPEEEVKKEVEKPKEEIEEKKPEEKVEAKPKEEKKEVKPKVKPEPKSNKEIKK